MKRMIIAAEEFKRGTTYYKVTKKMLDDFFKDDDNIVLKYLEDKFGFEAFDIDKMWGSLYDTDEDVMYICETDGDKIKVKSEYVDPEEALEDFSIDDLTSYIEDGSDETLRRHFTGSELLPVADIEQVVIDLLNDDYSLKDVLQALDDADLLDDYLD